MADQVDIVAGNADLGGTMRLGAYPAELKPGSVVARGLRHTDRCPNGTGTATRSTTPTASGSRQAGLVISGTSPDGRLVEFVELPAERPPVLRGHPGAPGAEVAPDPGAPAVPGVPRRGAGVQRAPNGYRSRFPSPTTEIEPLDEPLMSVGAVTDALGYEVVESEPIFGGRVIAVRARPRRG